MRGGSFNTSSANGRSPHERSEMRVDRPGFRFAHPGYELHHSVTSSGKAGNLCGIRTRRPGGQTAPRDSATDGAICRGIKPEAA